MVRVKAHTRRKPVKSTKPKLGLGKKGSLLRKLLG